MGADVVCLGDGFTRSLLIEVFVGATLSRVLWAGLDNKARSLPAVVVTVLSGVAPKTLV